jgi:AbrB family looped-hinge helix DNA binding protein
MKSSSITVSSRGYILLPLSLRKEMEIKPGTQMLLKKEKDRIVLQTMPSFTEKLSGLTSGSFGNNAVEIDQFIDNERQEREP